MAMNKYFSPSFLILVCVAVRGSVGFSPSESELNPVPSPGVQTQGLFPGKVDHSQQWNPNAEFHFFCNVFQTFDKSQLPTGNTGDLTQKFGEVVGNGATCKNPTYRKGGAYQQFTWRFLSPSWGGYHSVLRSLPGLLQNSRLSPSESQNVLKLAQTVLNHRKEDGRRHKGGDPGHQAAIKAWVDLNENLNQVLG